MSTYFENTEWRKERLGKFTSSEIFKLMKSGRKKDELFGQTALTYINEKIAEIITGQAPEPVFAKALEWGAANELDAILTFQERFHGEVEHFGTGNPKFFPFYGISGGSPDALTAELVVEAKCPWTSSTHVDFLRAAHLPMSQHGEWLLDNKEEYYYQTQLNMLACDRKKAVLISYDPRVLNHQHRLAVLQVDLDPTFEAEITKRLDAAKDIVRATLNSFEVGVKGSAVTLKKIA